MVSGLLDCAEYFLADYLKDNSEITFYCLSHTTSSNINIDHSHTSAGSVTLNFEEVTGDFLHHV